VSEVSVSLPKKLELDSFLAVMSSPHHHTRAQTVASGTAIVDIGDSKNISKPSTKPTKLRSNSARHIRRPSSAHTLNRSQISRSDSNESISSCGSSCSTLRSESTSHRSIRKSPLHNTVGDRTSVLEAGASVSVRVTVALSGNDNKHANDDSNDTDCANNDDSDTKTDQQSDRDSGKWSRHRPLRLDINKSGRSTYAAGTSNSQGQVKGNGNGKGKGKGQGNAGDSDQLHAIIHNDISSSQTPMSAPPINSPHIPYSDEDCNAAVTGGVNDASDTSRYKGRFDFTKLNANRYANHKLSNTNTNRNRVEFEQVMTPSAFADEPLSSRAENHKIGSAAAGGQLEEEKLQRTFALMRSQTMTHLHDHSVRIFAGTWNLHAKPAPENLSDFIPPGEFDVYCIGTEECENTIEMSMFFPSKSKWVAQLKELLGPEYIIVAQVTLQAIHCIVFVTQSLAPSIANVEAARLPTGIANTLGNKGGVGICFDIGRSSMAVVNCHFAAHQNNIKKRNIDFHKINRRLALRKTASSRDPIATLPLSERFSNVIWMGDLNYRVNGNREVVDVLLERNMMEVLIANDQLSIERRKRNAFVGFNEGELSFPPTYKFDAGCDVYDTSKKQRIPSWTDRILYKSNAKGSLTLVHYNSVNSIKTSDHRPVRAEFQLRALVEQNPEDISRENTIISSTHGMTSVSNSANSQSDSDCSSDYGVDSTDTLAGSDNAIASVQLPQESIPDVVQEKGKLHEQNKAAAAGAGAGAGADNDASDKPAKSSICMIQ
jgi:endonuclease/exonuclease/phosphatase family metal-dependent hydrolase